MCKQLLSLRFTDRHSFKKLFFNLLPSHRIYINLNFLLFDNWLIFYLFLGLVLMFFLSFGVNLIALLLCIFRLGIGFVFSNFVSLSLCRFDYLFNCMFEFFNSRFFFLLWYSFSFFGVLSFAFIFFNASLFSLRLRLDFFRFFLVRMSLFLLLFFHGLRLRFGLRFLLFQRFDLGIFRVFLFFLFGSGLILLFIFRFL